MRNNLNRGLGEFTARTESRINIFFWGGGMQISAECKEKAHSKSCAKLKMTGVQCTYFFLRKERKICAYC